MTSTLVAAPGAPYFTPFQDIPAGTALNPQKNGEPIPKLFQPLKIRGVEFQNRVFVSPMAMFGAENGLVTPWLLAHLGGMILRGPGLTFTEGVAVLPEGRTSVQDAGLWSDTHAEAFRPIVDFAHSQGQKIGVQLAHGGRKASTVAVWLKAEPTAPKEVGGWPENVWGSSNRQYAPGFPEPKELSIEGIKNIVRAFADAAKRAVAAGFDVIEVHSAHGFLLSEFLSPSSNNRKDVYGGSFENRIRFTLEVVDAIRAVIPDDMPLLVRVSGTEWLEEVAPDEPQWTKEDTAKLAPILADHGVDLIDVSTGGLNPRQKIRSGPEYQVPFAAAAKESAGSKILVGAVGGLYEGKTANGVVESGRADVVFVGRQFLKNPGHVLQMAEDLGVGIQYAHQLGWPFTGRATQHQLL